MFATESYTIVAMWFPRLLGIIYFFAFGAFLFQIQGLLCSRGILPISEYLDAIQKRFGRKVYKYIPSLFWINSSDKAIFGLIVAGTAISILLILGVYPSLMLLLLYILYLSLVAAGQDFLSFGWEGFLLEVTANAFLLSLTTVPNLMVWISLNLVLFRFHFQGGIVKIWSKDATWRDLSAVAYHYQTQPIPNTIAWYVHKLPLWFQKASTYVMLVIEIIVPFAIFGTDEMRLGVFILFVGLQFFIWLTGNFSFLNHLTVIFSIILLSNIYLSSYIPVPVIEATPLYLDMFLSVIGLFLIIIQVIQLSFKRDYYRQWFSWLSPFHLANRYGIFAVMTTKRYEIVVEGSEDKQIWKEYFFKYKPSDLTYRPRRISPYQPRLDWQIWFLPFSNFDEEGWFQSFMEHLLLGTSEVLGLIRENPFPNRPPKYVRALMYDYEFSSFQEKREHGWWWRRTFVGYYSPTMMLKNAYDN